MLVHTIMLLVDCEWNKKKRCPKTLFDSIESTMLIIIFITNVVT